MDETQPPTDDEILLLTPTERRKKGIAPSEVTEALVETMVSGGREDKVIEGATLPEISLEHRSVSGRTNHPVVFRDCEIERLNLDFADVQVPILIEASTVGEVSAQEATIRDNLELHEVVIEGDIDVHEARFEGNAEFEESEFRGEATFDEAVFNDDVSYDGSVFESEARFRVTEFYGKSNMLEDNTSFDDTVFEERADFSHSAFEYTSFSGAEFRDDAVFEKSRFEGLSEFPGMRFEGEAEFSRAVFEDKAVFEGVVFYADAVFEKTVFDRDGEFEAVVFEGAADFDEAEFKEDVSFADAEFRNEATFTGTVFEGGDRALEADADFSNTKFCSDCDFQKAEFRGADFSGSAFVGHAMFQESVYDGDADFPNTVFESEADFDEVRFNEDVDFSGVRFEKPVVFRGAEFLGEANHLEDDATFENGTFVTDADFDNAKFTSGNFVNVDFGGIIDFRGVEFTERVDFKAESMDRDTYVNLTGATIRDGVIKQPEERWMRYDVTEATLGDVSLEAAQLSDEHEVLDYFRFCVTKFDGFDFSENKKYLERNDWNLHSFDENEAEFEYAVEMTPDVIEDTYLMAQNSASEVGNKKASSEFRIKRRQYSRKKNVELLKEGRAFSIRSVKKLGLVLENLFMEKTCGYGERLTRITLLVALTPLPIGFLYSLGGPFETSVGGVDSISALLTGEGLDILWNNVYFSYVTYTTVGYGNNAPVGWLARLLAGSSAIIGGILAALLVYSLSRRVER